MTAGRKLRGLAGAPAFANFAFALGLKGVSFLYSMVIVGVASRGMSASDTASLLLGFNFLVPLGLIQVGLGTLAFRAVAHAHAHGKGIADLDEVAGAFRTIFWLALIALAIAVPMFLYARICFLIPIAILMLIGMICSPVDQIRSGTERSWTSNLFLVGSYCLCASIFFTLRHEAGGASLALLAILSYGATAIATISSFLAMLRDPEFRTLLGRGRHIDTFSLLKPSLPIIATSAGSALLLNIPAIGALLPWYPHLRQDDVVLLRVCSLCINTLVFLVSPMMPTVIRYRARGGRREFGRAFACYALGFGAVSLGLGALLWFGTPALTHLWLGRAVTDAAIAHHWAIALVLWAFGVVCAQYAIMTDDPWCMAAIYLGCDLLIILSAVGHLKAPGIDVPITIAIGMLVYCGGSATLMFNDAVKMLGLKARLVDGDPCPA